MFKLTAIALVAAVRTIQFVDAQDGSPRLAFDVADEDLVTVAEAIGPTLEGKTARQKNTSITFSCLALVDRHPCYSDWRAFTDWYYPGGDITGSFR